MTTPSSYRICPACCGGQFALVSHQGRTYLECVHCDARPFPAWPGAQLPCTPLEPEDLGDFVRRLEGQA